MWEIKPFCKIFQISLSLIGETDHLVETAKYVRYECQWIWGDLAR